MAGRAVADDEDVCFGHVDPAGTGRFLKEGQK
jgi:hypothetical protein